jgi:nucleotide-binding universal stress UspA family protein
MSSRIAKIEQSFSRPSPVMRGAQDPDRRFKVLIPYDGSESGEIALEELSRAGLPDALEAIVAVTNVWLPMSPYEISRAVSARRMRVLTAGASSFAPALRDCEEQRALSLEAQRRISSAFPFGAVRTEALQDTATVVKDIVTKAKQCRAQLIIVGSNTNPTPDITDYAEPALKVAREAHCSVRIARACYRRDDGPTRNMIAVVGSVSRAKVVDVVAARAWPRGSETRLVLVPKDGPRDARSDAQAILALDQATEELRAKGLTVSLVTREGNPRDVLLDEARKFAADCIFFDARGFSYELDGDYDRRGLSKVAETLLLGAHCSVEIVRAKAFGDEDLDPAA